MELSIRRRWSTRGARPQTVRGQCRLLTPWTLASVMRKLRTGRVRSGGRPPAALCARGPPLVLTVLKRRPISFSLALFSTLAFRVPAVGSSHDDGGDGFRRFFLNWCPQFFPVRSLPLVLQTGASGRQRLVFYRTGSRACRRSNFSPQAPLPAVVDKLGD